jgi:hypothetical protein
LPSVAIPLELHPETIALSRVELNEHRATPRRPGGNMRAPRERCVQALPGLCVEERTDSQGVPPSAGRRGGWRPVVPCRREHLATRTRAWLGPQPPRNRTAERSPPLPRCPQDKRPDSTTRRENWRRRAFDGSALHPRGPRSGTSWRLTNAVSCGDQGFVQSDLRTLVKRA